MCCFGLCTCSTWCCLNQILPDDESSSSYENRSNTTSLFESPRERSASCGCSTGFCLSVVVFIVLLAVSREKHSHLHIPILCPDRSCHHIGLLPLLLVSSIPFWLCFLHARCHHHRHIRHSSYQEVVTNRVENDEERPSSYISPQHDSSLVEDNDGERPPPTAPHPVRPSAPVEEQPDELTGTQKEDYGSIPVILGEDMIPVPPPVVNK